MSETTPDIAFVPATWNRREVLLDTLGRIADAAAACEAVATWEIVVVDNGSDDGSADAVSERFPDVHVERLEENTGVAAYNTGFRLTTAPLTYVCDDDAWPDPEGLAAAVRYMNEHDECGMVAFHVRHPETGASEWDGAPGADAFHDDWYNAVGCALLTRKDLLEDLGGYEEAFFLYYNDFDLALRTLGAGRTVVYDPSWDAWHARAPQQRDSAAAVRFRTRNILWTARMHFGGLTLASVLLNHLLGHLRLAARATAPMAFLRGLAAGLFAPTPRPRRRLDPENPGVRRYLSRHSLFHRIGSTE